MLKIEKGVEIPDRRNEGIAKMLSCMDVGDSVLIASWKSSANLGGIQRGSSAKKFTARKVEGGVRVWRIA